MEDVRKSLEEKRNSGKWPVPLSESETIELSDLAAKTDQDNELSEEDKKRLEYLNNKKYHLTTEEETLLLTQDLVLKGFIDWAYDITGAGNKLVLRTLRTEETQEIRKNAAKFKKDDLYTYVQS